MFYLLIFFYIRSYTIWTIYAAFNDYILKLALHGDRTAFNKNFQKHRD